VKGAHLARADVVAAAVDAAAAAAAKAQTKAMGGASDKSTADDGEAALAEARREGVDDAMEAVFYFTYSLPLMQEQWRREQEQGMSHGCVTSTSADASSNPASSSPTPPSHPYGMLEFLQYPGETVYVPAGWLHAVLNLSADGTIAVTQNFVSAQGLAASWTDAVQQRPHMARRWREQMVRQHPQLAQQHMPPPSEWEQKSQQQPRHPRRPDVPLDEACEDGESWYWNPSSEEEEEEEEDDGADEDSNAAKEGEPNASCTRSARSVRRAREAELDYA